MNDDVAGSPPAGGVTTVEERQAIHDELGKLFADMNVRHPNAMLVLQVATPDAQGNGFDVLTLYSHGSQFPMFLQAMADTAMALLGPQPTIDSVQH